MLRFSAKRAYNIDYFGSLPFQSRSKKPSDPAYFTGNSNYYQYLATINSMLVKYSLPIASGSIKHSAFWKDRVEMSDRLEMRLDDQKYHDLIGKLETLKPFQGSDPVLNKLLTPFVSQSKSLLDSFTGTRSLDEQGRAHALASRKTAKSQAWLVPGDGQVFVNGVHVADYFDGFARLAATVIKPFEVTSTLGKYNAWTSVTGGGKRSQSEAIAVALSRTLTIMDPKTSIDLPAELTRVDNVQKERKKTGQPKARKKNTWVKR